MTVLLVALGAAVGAPLRYLLARHLDGRLHLGTLLVNVAGSLLLGLCAGWSLDGSAYALLGTGLCGGLTTYSALAVQARDRGARLGTAYGVATVTLGLLACTLGYVVAGG